jgi:hypothetical protein
MQPIDLENLRRDAFSSSQGESYTPLQPHECCRVGVGARINQGETQYFIEVVVTLCRGEKPDLTKIEEKLHLLKNLETRGYSMTCEDDGSLSCEIQLSRIDFEAELERFSDTHSPQKCG